MGDGAELLEDGRWCLGSHTMGVKGICVLRVLQDSLGTWV